MSTIFITHVHLKEMLYWKSWEEREEQDNQLGTDHPGENLSS